MTEPIFHLAAPDDWARSTDEYRTASLDEEGFIHCSTAGQLGSVARRLFMDHNDLILVTIDPNSLDDEALVYEDLDGEGTEYPHVYGALPHSAVTATGPYLEHLEEGMWSQQRWDREWMDRMLHPDFTEVGHSGRAYDREATIDAEPSQFEFELPLEGYRLLLIDEDVALVHYVSRIVSDDSPPPVRRTSIWVNTNQGWRLRFHQGTPLR